MSKVLISFDREFQIWKYTVGHSQLLLRSNKTSACPTRIDVFFKNVGAIHLPSTFTKLSIREGSSEDESQLNVLSAASVIPGHRKVFVIDGSNFMGYVVAGLVVWHEDQGEYHEPSFFSKENDI